MSPSSCQGIASAVPQGTENRSAFRRWAEFFNLELALRKARVCRFPAAGWNGSRSCQRESSM